MSALERLRLLEPAKIVFFTLRKARPSVVFSEIKVHLRGAPDGMPVPGPRLCWLVVRNPWATLNLEGGRVLTENMFATLAKNGVDVSGLGSVLDFGCGCGRMTRFLSRFEGVDVYGTDYNQELIDWCSKNLKFAHFDTNLLEPPLSYDDGKFDLVCVYSVFTHLTYPLQKAWMAELRRVLKVGGHLYFTMMGTRNLDGLTPEERRRYDFGEAVILNEELVGQNLCGAFGSLDFVKENLAEDFELVDYVPQPKKGTQDVFLMRKT